VVHDPVAKDGEAAPDPLGVGRLDVVPAGEVKRDPVVGEATGCGSTFCAPWATSAATRRTRSHPSRRATNWF
jgi:hypothetical protein